MLRLNRGSVEEFERLLEEKNIICFGRGKKFIELCNRFQIQNYVNMIIDNNATYGMNIKMGNKIIPVIKPDKLKIVEKNKSLVVITSIQYAKDMITQLDGMDEYDGVDCYVPEIFYSEETYSPPKNQKPVIPKTIHYFWFGNNEMPQQFQDNIKTWKKYCPDYEIRKWDESNYDIHKCAYMAQAYAAKKWGFVPDYARLDVLNQYGGIYLDTDVELVRSLDDLLFYDMFCGFESWKYVAFGLGFGTVQDNIILKEMMEDYESASFINSDGALNLTASPVYQTKILKRHGLIQNGKTQQHDNYITFATEYFSPLNFCGNGNITDKTYSIHQYAATWMEKEEAAVKLIYFQGFKWIEARMEL